MAYRPAQVYNGSGWDDIGDKRIGAQNGDIPQASVANLTTDLAAKAATVKQATAPTGNAQTIWYDSSTTPPTPKFWDGSAWVPFSSGMLTASDILSTTGSPTIGSYTSGGIGYTFYQWTGDGTVVTSRGGYCEALIVGAGGGGSFAGGGGGGQHLLVSAFWLPSGTTNIKVGAGGAGNAASGSLNTANGGFSGLGDVRAIGGGYGRYLSVDTSIYAGSGASGGGIGISGTNPVAGASLIGAGNGALGGSSSGGGGGGSGGNGSAGSSGTGGNGGAGTSNSITNTAVGRCGGGAGGGGTAGGTASDGGGAGSTATGTAGAANKGGGGGGGWNNGGAAGGSGTVIIKVRS